MGVSMRRTVQLSVTALSGLSSGVDISALLEGECVFAYAQMSSGGRAGWAYSLAQKPVPDSLTAHVVEKGAVIGALSGMAAEEIQAKPVVLQVEDLHTHFFTNDGVVRAVDGVN